MDAFRVSVVVANYNHAHYLPQCLDAIFAQERAADEVIVIDDGSTDNSIEVIERYAHAHPELRIVRHMPNQGVIAVMNRGLTEARTDYVLFAAADDWMLPGLLKHSMELLERNPQAGLCSSLSLQLTDDRAQPKPLPTAIVLDRPGYIAPGEALTLLLKEDSWFLGNTIVIRRDAVIAAGGYRPELTSFCDGFVYQQVALKLGACFIPEPLAVWRVLGAGYSASSVINVERVAQIRHNVSRLMAAEFSELFPCDYVKRWQRRWSYIALNGALRGGDYDTEVLARLWPDASAIDRAVLGALARAGGFGRRAGVLYLFSRLRLADLPTLVNRRLYWRSRAQSAS